jgi:hypothetical protein
MGRYFSVFATDEQASLLLRLPPRKVADDLEQESGKYSECDQAIYGDIAGKYAPPLVHHYVSISNGAEGYGGKIESLLEAAEDTKSSEDAGPNPDASRTGGQY